VPLPGTTQLGDVGGDAPRLVAGEQLGYCSPPRLIAKRQRSGIIPIGTRRWVKTLSRSPGLVASWAGASVWLRGPVGHSAGPKPIGEFVSDRLRAATRGGRQFDGFNMVGTTPVTSQSFGIGFSIVGDNGGTAVASHHVWLLNSTETTFERLGSNVMLLPGKTSIWCWCPKILNSGIRGFIFKKPLFPDNRRHFMVGYDCRSRAQSGEKHRDPREFHYRLTLTNPFELSSLIIPYQLAQ